MVTTATHQTTFANEPSNLEMHWTAEDGRLRSRWNITPQIERLKPVWLESARDRASVSRHAALKVHSSRLLHALCWVRVFLL